MTTIRYATLECIVLLSLMTFQPVFYIPYVGKGTMSSYRVIAHPLTKVTKTKATKKTHWGLHAIMIAIYLMVNNYALKRIEMLGGDA